MKKLLATSVAVAFLVALTGCTAPPAEEPATPNDLAMDACKSEVENQVDADSYDWSKVSVEDLAKALEDAGIADEKNEAGDKITVFGDLVSTTDGQAKTHTIICTVDVQDGKAVIADEHPAITNL